MRASAIFLLCFAFCLSPCAAYDSGASAPVSPCTNAQSVASGTNALSAGQLNDAIETVIRRVEYSWRLPRSKTITEDPSGLEIDASWLETLSRQIEKAAEEVAKFILTVLKKLRDLFPSGEPGVRTRQNTDWETPVRILTFVLLGLVLSVLAIIVYRAVRSRRKAAPAMAVAVDTAPPDLNDENVPVDALESDEWFRLARQCMERGDMRLAIRAMYLGCLSSLAQGRLIVPARHKSNRDYLRELSLHRGSSSPVSSALASNIGILERAWYGQHPVTEDAVASFSANRDIIVSGSGRSSGGTTAALLVAMSGIILVAGVLHLLFMRFSRGDVYPPYSSLRSDALGCKVLYDSLEETGLTASRNFEYISAESLPAPAVLFILGDTIERRANSDTIPGDIAASLNTFMRSGGRVVYTLMPRNFTSKQPKTQVVSTNNVGASRRSQERHEKAKRFHRDDDSEDVPVGYAGYRRLSVTNWLGLSFKDISFTNATGAILDSSCPVRSLPRRISNHTSLCVTNASREWRTIYRNNYGYPVVLEKTVGKGSIVISTPTFFVSNEALRDERHSDLLAWLVGGHRVAIFDEMHHGIVHEVGMTDLLRKYRLQSFFAGVLVLGVLYLWRKCVGIVPVRTDGAGTQTIEGHGSIDGLVNVLRKNIPRDRVLATAVGEWKRTAGAGGRVAQSTVRTIEERYGEDAVTLESAEFAYNSIARMTNNRRNDRRSGNGGQDEHG